MDPNVDATGVVIGVALLTGVLGLQLPRREMMVDVA